MLPCTMLTLKRQSRKFNLLLKELLKRGFNLLPGTRLDLFEKDFLERQSSLLKILALQRSNVTFSISSATMLFIVSSACFRYYHTSISPNYRCCIVVFSNSKL